MGKLGGLRHNPYVDTCRLPFRWSIECTECNVIIRSWRWRTLMQWWDAHVEGRDGRATPHHC